jgi:pimeloyl-ACP methyl ester carboxylesterase
LSVDGGHEIELHGRDGLRLAATRFGPATGPGVLFLHGFGQTRHAWRSVASRLARRGWSVLTLDLRGHGESAWAEAYRFVDFEDDVEVATQTFDAPPAVVGASMGGILGLIGQAERDFASALVLVDVVPHFDNRSGQRVQAFMAAHRDGFATLDEAARVIDGFLVHRRRPDRVDGLLSNLRQDDTGRYRWKWDPRFAEGVDWIADYDGTVDEMAELMRERMIAAAQSLTIPTLLVRGGLSDFVPEEAARAFVDLVPHAEFVDVAGAGHMVAGDRNDAFGDAVEAFLQRRRADAVSG